MNRQFKEYPTDARNADIAKLCKKLQDDIDRWRKQQLECWPKLQHFVINQKVIEPENESLYLPSDFQSPVERTDFGLEEAGLLEMQLREGEANDALEAIRLAIKQLALDVQYKKKEVTGQKDSTRAHDELKRKCAARNKYVIKYRQAFRAMIRLGMVEGQTPHKELKDSDLRIKGMTGAGELGEGTKEESWIWSAMFDPSLPVSQRTEWENEFDRVRWFRAKANKDRWEEEIDILEEEFQRTKRSFARMEQVWKALAHVCDDTAEGWGKRAYAHQQVGMYQLLNKRAHGDFLKTKSHKPIPALAGFVAV
ncbi:hypothetical protein M422DRAFT_195437 [Sphaerobolus stellatus SS14]|uniref:Uncharacterized protein n=1 Tax=Sphaerobolus stellatus (strain SS14) TaxID=990650 RepID=A0A0C9U3Y5_SPHS4|nr:hypothetical protein M422DRAFT_195437 [Sphaerobolus stellatus SS14]